MSVPIAEAMLVEVYRRTRITPDQLRVKSREHRVVKPRQAIMLALRERTEWSSPQIAQIVNLKDHTTVLHGIKAARALCQIDPAFQCLVSSLIKVPPIHPGVLDCQIERVAAGLPPVPESVSEVISPAQIIAGIAAQIREAERKRDDRSRLIDEINDGGIDWASFDWRSGQFAHRANISYGSTVNDKGECCESTRLRDNIIAGSKRLLSAIEQARAA